MGLSLRLRVKTSGFYGRRVGNSWRSGWWPETPGTARTFPSVLEAIGRTPLVELSRIASGDSGRIIAKLEYLNPGFSKKDRVARQIIEDAEKAGELEPGQTVVELTSGNTGTGLAIVCAIKG